MDESHKHIQRAARHLRKAKQAYPGFLDFNLDLEPPSEDWLYQYLDDKGTDYVDHQ